MLRQASINHNQPATMPDFLQDFQEMGFGDVHFKHDKKTGLIAIIAIHSTKRGPSLGGCRFIEYPNSYAAIIDALRLARGMSYKAAISNLPLGGGKAVIIKHNGIKDRNKLLQEFAKFVDELGGRYITAEDSGTSVADMDLIRETTKYVVGTSKSNFQHADPSPITALGVRRGVEAAVKFKLGKDSVAGVKVAIQGVGNVGYYLAKELHALGAKLQVCDVNKDAVKRVVSEFGATAVLPEEIYQLDCDVFAPCALGAVLNPATLPLLKAKIVAGAANNQLATSEIGMELKRKDILYAPDYVINAGGVIHVNAQLNNSSEAQARKQVEAIYDTVTEVFERSKRDDNPTDVVADTIAEEKLA